MSNKYSRTSKQHTKDSKNLYLRPDRDQEHQNNAPKMLKIHAKIPSKSRTPNQERQNNNIPETPKIYTCILIEPQPCLSHPNWLLFC
ncbi:7607_t:CDS:2 [Dentiscutata erythropus]|uniref:7607_t:CDS:1 n=1 Tax=Dentiscutata erythropus TaxID=1348616 RepID=A0A9N9IZB7_9GLOM|nr:7607_t:CDS:2 [Dentiscutata erythropus]